MHIHSVLIRVHEITTKNDKFWRQKKMEVANKRRT